MVRWPYPSPPQCTTLNPNAIMLVPLWKHNHFQCMNNHKASCSQHTCSALTAASPIPATGWGFMQGTTQTSPRSKSAQKKPKTNRWEKNMFGSAPRAFLLPWPRKHPTHVRGKAGSEPARRPLLNSSAQMLRTPAT